MNRSPRVGFQGELGAYSEEAVRQAIGVDATPVPYRGNAEVAEAVATGDVDFGVLPIENTLVGSVIPTYDAILAAPNVHVSGETLLPIHHCVLAPPGATLATLRTIESHPVALGQCAHFFTTHPRIEARAAYDTAGAARDVAGAQDPARGAIASRIAAQRYRLNVLAADVEDRADNTTRFLVLSRTPTSLPDGVRARTMLIASTQNVPGALLRLLAPFAEREVNLVKLESRPTGEPWTYRFILEMEHASGDARAEEAIELARKGTVALRVVGTYAAATR